jgi:hypothetical protein
MTVTDMTCHDAALAPTADTGPRDDAMTCHCAVHVATYNLAVRDYLSTSDNKSGNDDDMWRGENESLDSSVTIVAFWMCDICT